MTVAAARRFLKRLVEDDAFRTRLVKAPTRAARSALLSAEELTWEDDELDDARRGLLVDCRVDAQAAAVMEAALFWRLLDRSPDASPPQREGTEP